ncbi:MAG TPA: DUF2520 domain-containing protein [Candidatus Anoxymicrobiaceae bacterium]
MNVEAGPASESSRKVAIIGSGRVGTAMALLLSERGYDVVCVADPEQQVRTRAAGLSGAEPVADDVEAARLADIIIITTPDSAIASTCRSIVDSGVEVRGKKFVHMSGALSLTALEPARHAGAQVLSIHPLQTFADMEGAVKALPGSTFGVTCEPSLEGWASVFVSDLEGTMQLIRDEDKVLYHAAAVMASNFLAMMEYAALTIARGLGFSDDAFAEAFAPLYRASVENVARLGPVEALTGPLVRGDAGTIEKHLTALAEFDPGLATLYSRVCLWGLNLVEERGNLDRESIDQMRALLESS